MCEGAPFCFFKAVCNFSCRTVHLTAKQPPLQQDVVDPSHHPRSPLLSMQVIVSSSTLDASPDLSHRRFSGKPDILDILQRLKDKEPLSTNKAEPCTLPE